jgi:phosphinothricin acetyltransferase
VTRPEAELRPTLRLATAADGADCAAIYAPYVASSAVSFELQAPGGTEMGARIARTLERAPWIVADVDGRVRAYAYATRFRDRPAYDWTAETTVYVDAEYRRQGLGDAVMTALLAILQVQGYHAVVAGITPPNPGSVALHLALGFRRVGQFDAVGWKAGEWHGVEFFELELSPRASRPEPVRLLPDLLASAPGSISVVLGEGR